jgi:hypothetical protein
MISGVAMAATLGMLQVWRVRACVRACVRAREREREGDQRSRDDDDGVETLALARTRARCGKRF